MTGITWFLLLGGVALNAAAQLLLKAATTTSGALISDSGDVSWRAATAVLQAPPLWAGLACYGISLVVWLGGLSRAPVSVAYPLLSIGYVINAVAAAYLFGEAITAAKIVGIGLVIAGIFFLTRATA
jgi:multidrug transporter EmrE-like cation transporter